FLHRAPRRRNSVHHFVVDRRAQRLRIAVIILERRPRFMLPRVLLGHFVQFLGGHSRLHFLPQFRQRAPHNQSRAVHCFQLRRGTADNHSRFSSRPSAEKTAVVTSATLASPLISSSTPFAR